jgi:Flp pilus assembly protein TadG
MLKRSVLKSSVLKSSVLKTSVVKTAVPKQSARMRDESGAAAVEFALVFPMLILVLFGIIEFGAMYNAQLMVTGAAREGARSMAISGDPAVAKLDTIDSAIGLSLTASEVAISRATCAVGQDVSVVITHKQHFLTGMFGATIDLTGKATRRCNG